jgi:pimeloyl-ACP methyl ester carboxylesterase
MESWVLSAYQEKKIDRYCYWDRPGFGFSENAPSPLSAGMAVDALSEALLEAGENGPWVLVSHGVGGIYSRIFASRHVAEVKGLLLIDVLPESQLHQVGSARRGFVLWLRGVISPLGIDSLMGAIFMGRSRADRIYGRSAYQNGKQIKAKLQENLVATTFTRNEIAASSAILPKDVPFVVVSSGKAVKADQQWSDGQRELTEITENLVAWDVVNHAPHKVWSTMTGSRLLVKRLEQLLHR